MIRVFVSSFLVATCVLHTTPTALAFTDLAGGKTLIAREHLISKKDLLKFKYKDPAIDALVDPTCAGGNPSSLQILTSNGAKASVALPCANWKASGSAFIYKAPLGDVGGVRTIKYKAGLLTAKIQDSDYSSDPVIGPIDWIETRVNLGSTSYCGRWEAPPSSIKTNLVNKVKFKGPTGPCLETCGNGVVETGEDCDDGNLANGDGCRDDCTIESCGDGVVDPGEACDDGNTAGGDCCDALCAFEPNGSVCDDDLNVCTDDVCDGAGSCTHPDNAAPCSDDNGCTVNDTCSGGVCGGEYVQPWVNEFDYDSNDGGFNNDRDEFVELAGPAGLDLSGYQIVSVEGSNASCGTPFFITAGDAHFIATIPPGSVLADDTGTGIGFFVVCFTNTSTHVSDCDVTLSGSAADSNLKNGHLTNADLFSCPDGILLLDDGGGYVDAVSYEGVVANTGTWGGYFHIDVPYSAERDEGWLEQISIYKNSSTLQRAASASEWTDPSELGGLTCSGQIGLFCPTNLDTPGIANPGQSLACGSPCAAFLDVGEGLLE